MTAPLPAAARGRVFWGVVLLILADNALFTSVVPALPEYADRFGLSVAAGAVIFAAFPVAQLVVALAAGTLADRVGRRPVLLASAVLMVVATLAFALAAGPLGLAGARVLQGCAAGLAWTAGIAALCDVYPARELGLRLGLAQSAGGAGGLVGPFVAGPLIAAVGVSTAFGLLVLLPLAVLCVLPMVPETRGAGLATPPPLPALRRLMGQPRARAGALALATFAAVLALLEPLLPRDLDDRLGLSPAGVGLVFGCALLALFVASPVAGRWSDGSGGRVRPLLVGGVIAGAALPFTAHLGAVGVALAMLLVGVGIGILGAPAAPLLAEAVERAGMPGSYGLSASIMTLVFAAGYVVGPLAGAAASAVAPFSLTVLVAGLVVVLVAARAARLAAAG